MTPERRELMLKVMDGRPDLAPLLYQLTFMRRCDEMLKHLVRSRLTGAEFARWFAAECHGSPMTMFRNLIAALERDRETRAVYANRDYLIGD